MVKNILLTNQNQDSTIMFSFVYISTSHKGGKKDNTEKKIIIFIKY